MQRDVVACLTLTALLAPALSATEPPPRITVFVYNYAEIPSGDLARTKEETGRIYRQSGVQIDWLYCPRSPQEAAQFPACQIPPGPSRLAVRLLSRSMAERMGRVRDSFGFALYPDDGSFATVANVFAHRAEQIAKRHRIHRAVILGHIVAHELGHLLLGPGSHSSTGIMHVPWLPKELESVTQGSMLFLPAEARRIQSGVRARMAAAL